MPRTYNHLYEWIYDFGNLYEAYLKARRGKRYTSDCLRFSAALEENLITLQNELIWRTYRTGRYREFYVMDPKRRLVAALPFRDRVVHHALCNVIEPIFDKRFIFDSYACRAGKGTHAGVERLTFFLRRAQREWGQVYVLKADIASYFPSIDHDILRRILFRTIRCDGTRWLIDEILGSTVAPGELRPRGIPIGNLTSQLWANIYLNELDQFIKHELRARYYVRYMDDFVMLHHEKRWLHNARREIEAFLDTNLALRLNDKTSVFPISRGIDFLGYRIWPTHRLLRKRFKVRARRALRHFRRLYAAGRIDLARIRASIQSWVGHARHANSYRFMRKLLGEEARFTRGEVTEDA